MTALIDTFGRVHRDMRVSVTDRCNLRCTYCMPADFSDWLPGDHLLSIDEMLEVIEIATEHGIESIRLTGGEPLLRPDLVEIVRRINALPLKPRISLTTNALRLEALAQPLADAGLERVNVSLDTLDRARFSELTKRDRFADVLSGIEAAQRAGLTPLKVNTVLMRGINDDEAVPLLQHAVDNGWSLRFIEQMPLDAQGSWDRGDMVTAAEILELLSEHFALTPVPTRGSAPAEEFYVNGGPATVGIIASVSKPFCAACDRIRLTADGQVRNCLFSLDETDLRATLRDGDLPASERRERIGRLFQTSVTAKLPGHGINDPSFIQPDRPMSAIGG
ncbi:MAG: GTP 3',8-cyclase MoaA [Actinomycetes bacterium]|jgi:cyclic pyranopterin phosphate synthase